MSTTIERAITALVQADKPITVPNTLAAYLQLAVFADSSMEDVSNVETTEAAILAFEHALDKHPSPPPLPTTRRMSTSKVSASICAPSTPSAWTRLYMAEVAQLRKEYWTERIGSASGMRCTCSKCGRTIKYMEEKEPELLETQRQVGGKRNTGRKRWFLVSCS